nr:terpene cyclase/mutase family protein [Planctomycetota bacterium]
MQDFGLLLDYIRGELDTDQAASVRSRLEREADFFAAFERLRRTLDVIRCLPSLDGQFTPPQPSTTEALPLVQPRPEFVASLRREYHARGWAAFVPMLNVKPEFAANLRTEFSVRSLLIALPWLNVRAEFVSALRTEFAARSLVASLPALSVRPDFARALNAEFCVRSIVGMLPMLSVREAFARRVKIALYEASRESAAEPQPMISALPLLEPSDNFRRRVFNAIRNAARKPLRERPARALAAIYAGAGRELTRAIRKSKSLAFTAGVHVLAIVAALFIVGHAGVVDSASLAVSMNTGPSPIVAPGSPIGSPHNDMPGDRPASVGEAGWGGEEKSLPSAPEERGYDEAPAPQLPADEAAMPEPYKPVGMGGGTTSTKAHSEFAMFRLRGEGRHKKIGYLGSSELYDTLSRALVFLRDHQKSGGFWEPEGVSYVPAGPESTIQRVELTAASALAFLGDGHSSAASELGYQDPVRKAIDWLLKQQNEDGQIGPAERGIVYCHAIALMALIEDFALTGRYDLRAPIRKACRWLVESRPNDGSGAFPYGRGDAPSLMTSVWGFMALETARVVKVPNADAPKARMDELLAWFDNITNKEPLLDSREALQGPAELIPTAAAYSLTFFPREGTYEMRRSSYQSKLFEELP